MIVKRRVTVPVVEYEQRTLKFTLSKSQQQSQRHSRKDDFGIVLGCRFYIKEICNPKLAEKEPGLREGDTVLRINGQSLDGSTLEDATRLLDRSRDHLCLVIQRDVVQRGGSALLGSRWPSRNTVYERVGSATAGQIQPPNSAAQVATARHTPRHSPSPLRYSMVTSGGLPPPSPMHSHVEQKIPTSAAPSPAAWRPSSATNHPQQLQHPGQQPHHPHPDVYAVGRQRAPSLCDLSYAASPAPPGGNFPPSPAMGASSLPLRASRYHSAAPDDRTTPGGQPRTIVFSKLGGSVGVQLIGGNKAGVFVSFVQADSAAAAYGVCVGDRLIAINGKSVQGATREEAVQQLLAAHGQLRLALQLDVAAFETVRQQQIGDSFYIRCHIARERDGHAESRNPLELSLHEGDILHVTDTLFGGTQGWWQATRVFTTGLGPKGSAEPTRGVIPNLSTATAYALEQRQRLLSTSNQSSNSTSGGGGVGTLLRRKLETRRTRSLPQGKAEQLQSAKDQNSPESGPSLVMPAYERVLLGTPSFARPLVLWGPVADLARSRLLAQFPEQFAVPASANAEDALSGVTRLAAVDHVIQMGKHCVLDVGPDSVARLQVARYAPIVVLLDVDGRARIRQLRKRAPGAASLSSRQLSEQAAALKKGHAHLLSATVDATHEDGWFEALRELVAHLQQRRVWLPERTPQDVSLDEIVLYSSPSCAHSTGSSSGGGGGAQDKDDAEARKDLMSRSMCDGPPAGTQLSSSWHPVAFSHQQHHHQQQQQPVHGSLPRTTGNGNNYQQQLQQQQLQQQQLQQQQLQQQQQQQVVQQAQPVYRPAARRLSQEHAVEAALQLQQQQQANSLTRYGATQQQQQQQQGQNAPQQQPMNGARSPRTYDSVPSPVHHHPLQQQQQQQQQVVVDASDEVGRNVAPPLDSQPSSSSVATASASVTVTALDKRGVAHVLRPSRPAPPPSSSSTSPQPPLQASAGGSESVSTPGCYSAATAPPDATLGPSPSSTLGRQGLEGEDDEDDIVFSLRRAVDDLQASVQQRQQPPLATSDEAPTEEDENDEDEPQVVEQASCLVGVDGGRLCCPVSGVELIIPPGAIAPGERHEVYVRVCEGGSPAERPPVDDGRGEQLLSPLVVCGPQGLRFRVPVELRLPHVQSSTTAPGAAADQWSFALKSGDSDAWRQLAVAPSASSADYVAVQIDNF